MKRELLLAVRVVLGVVVGLGAFALHSTAGSGTAGPVLVASAGEPEYEKCGSMQCWNGERNVVRFWCVPTNYRMTCTESIPEDGCEPWKCEETTAGGTEMDCSFTSCYDDTGHYSPVEWCVLVPYASTCNTVFGINCTSSCTNP